MLRFCMIDCIEFPFAFAFCLAKTGQSAVSLTKKQNMKTNRFFT